MALISDILLLAGATGAAIYCYVLSQRLKRFNDLEKGVGGAVAVLSSRVDELTKTLTLAQETAANSAASLSALTAHAEESSRRIELQIASLHDLPNVVSSPPQTSEKAKMPEQKLAPAEPMFVRHHRQKEMG